MQNTGGDESSYVVDPQVSRSFGEAQVQSLLICAEDVPYFITPVSTNSMSLLTRCRKKKIAGELCPVRHRQCKFHVLFLGFRISG
jgi:hypothetical protein